MSKGSMTVFPGPLEIWRNFYLTSERSIQELRPLYRTLMRRSVMMLSWLRSVLVPILLLGFVVIYKVDRKYYISLTREDNVVEWATFGFLFVSGVLGLILAVRSYKARKGFVLFFGAFGILCVLFALEEISWGQRVFDIKSPEFFLQNNCQREINVHNVVQQRCGLKTKHVAGLSLFVYGACLPLLVSNRKAKRLLARYGLVVPPRALLSSFLLAAIMMFDWPTGQEEELGELFFSICFFFFMLGEFLTRDSDDPAREIAQSWAVPLHGKSGQS